MVSMDKTHFAESNCLTEDITIAYSVKMTWHYFFLSVKRI